MVEQQIRPWDVLDFDILDVLGERFRGKILLPKHSSLIYSDKTLPLPNGGNMLEPKIVARMIQALKLTPLDKVLEVGTGSGYATALLGKMAAEVITVDIDAEQQARAKTVLDNLGYKNITYQVADGLAAEIGGGLFDAIYIGGATNNIPEQLKNQLHEKGGHMVVVVGDAPVQRAL